MEELFSFIKWAHFKKVVIMLKGRILYSPNVYAEYRITNRESKECLLHFYQLNHNVFFQAFFKQLHLSAIMQRKITSLVKEIGKESIKIVLCSSCYYNFRVIQCKTVQFYFSFNCLLVDRIIFMFRKINKSTFI